MSDLISQQNIREFSKLEWFARQVVEGFITGLHKSPFHGFSVEFAEHRHYNPGDSTRHIDWKLYARTDKHFVKRYEEETNLRCQIVIDHSSSMYFPENKVNGENKVSFSVHAAAALTHLFRSQRDAVGLSLFSDTVDLHLPPKSNSAHLSRLYHQLELLLAASDANRETHVASALDEIAERVHQRSLILVFSDMFDGEEEKDLFRALQHLKYNKHEVVVFHVTDRSKEIDFNYENRPYTFIDMESGEQVKLNPSQVRETYQENAKAHESAIKLKCTQYGIDFVKADIADGFDQVLRAYLVKRARMK